MTTETITAIIGGVVALLTAAGAFLKVRGAEHRATIKAQAEAAAIRETRRMMASKSWKNGPQVDKVLEELGHRLGAMRVVALRGHNCNEAITPRSFKRTTAFADWCVPGVDSKVGRWTNETLDKQYNKLMAALAEGEAGHVLHLITDEMSPGKLRDVYLSDGVGCSIVVCVVVEEFELVYLSINFATRAGHDTPENRAEARAAASELRIYT